MNVQVEIEKGRLRILINGYVHFSIKRTDLIAVISHIKESFYIDFHTRTKKITTQYGNRKLWEQVLQKLKEKGIA